MKHLMAPDCTWMPEKVTSYTRPSSTSLTSGVEEIALKATLKITSPLVSWITPSSIFQSRSSSVQLARVSKKELHKQNDVAEFRVARAYVGLLNPDDITPKPLTSP